MIAGLTLYPFIFLTSVLLASFFVAVMSSSFEKRIVEREVAERVTGLKNETLYQRLSNFWNGLLCRASERDKIRVLYRAQAKQVGDALLVPARSIDDACCTCRAQPRPLFSMRAKFSFHHQDKRELDEEEAEVQRLEKLEAMERHERRKPVKLLPLDDDAVAGNLREDQWNLLDEEVKEWAEAEAADFVDRFRRYEMELSLAGRRRFQF